MERARQSLQLYFQPDTTGEDRAKTLELFGRALRFKPKWAVSQAFDKWERTETRRPAPGNIVKLADEAVANMAAELRHRGVGRIEEPQKERVSPEAAKAILEQAGFTPKRFGAVSQSRMASTQEQLDAADNPEAQKHWTETADPDGWEMQALRKAREGNKLMGGK